MSSRLASIGAVLTAAALAAAAPALAQKSGGVLHVTHRDNPPSASIHEEATISTVMPFMSLYNNLVVFDPKARQNSLDAIVPELATAWQWSEDGTQLTFTLRDGVKWHDGKPFTSADVKCTWDRIIGTTDARFRKNPRKPWYFNLKEVTTNGDREVTFRLGRPQPSLLAMLAGAFSPVYPCHVPAAQMRTKPIGTGPFKFVEFKQNESMKVVRNPDYWKPGRPYLDAIEFTIIANRSTALLAFIAGKFDLTFTGEVTTPLLKDIKSQAPQAVCEMQPTNTQANLLVNRDKPPFDDARVRRAMGLAIDRKAFVDIVAEGNGDIGGAMLPPPQGIWGMPPDVLATVAGYAPDVEKSREEGRKIMAALGYGPDKPLKIKVSTRNIAAYRDPAVILIDHLKQVYIEGELEPLDTPVWYARMARKDYSVGMNVQGVGIDDPDVVFYETFSCGSERNYTNYCNPELEKLFDQQSVMTDQAKRRALVWEIDKRLQEDGARPVIFHGRAATCWQPAVKGINLAVNTIYNHWRFEDVWLDK
ncbi:ABC transporter substrate-binding protein [Vineibacter terrae]|uniref:ABC transporter substrate-binding protein n=1 Tax=Vineibacter terrae TaxID=2586908 RepID=UPI002E322DE6|nr:ABC transporter substrate-binding protein [Vineibacter terrae]HEX2887379.1 ABC transporter substrate-binding protein [Vineibacter terrae]